jgi:hypothetical protein
MLPVLTGSFLPVSSVEDFVPQKHILIGRVQTLTDYPEKLLPHQVLDVAAHLPVRNANLGRKRLLSGVAGSVLTGVPKEPRIGEFGAR